MSSIDILRVRAVLGRKNWSVPQEFGPDGWRLITQPGKEPGSVIVTDGPVVLADPDTDYRHASIAFVDRMPTYDDLNLLHRAVWGEDGWSCQVFVPRAEHVNIHSHALHLWGRPDGARLLPAFGDGISV